jgi:hypothetical protein
MRGPAALADMAPEVDSTQPRHPQSTVYQGAITTFFGREYGTFAKAEAADHNGGYFSTARELGGIQSVT